MEKLLPSSRALNRFVRNFMAAIARTHALRDDDDDDDEDEEQYDEASPAHVGSLRSFLSVGGRPRKSFADYILSGKSRGTSLTRKI